MKIYLKEERNKEAYQQTLNIDIENINKIEISTNIIKQRGGKSMKLYNNNSL